jgi:hypothetical protein
MEVFKSITVTGKLPGNRELTVHRTKTTSGFDGISIKRSKTGLGDGAGIIHTSFDLTVEEAADITKLLQEIVDYEMRF